MITRFTALHHTAATPGERRSRRRQQVLKGGQIIGDSVVLTVDCILHDISDSGARLRLVSTAAIPKTFLLLIKEDNVIVPVQRVWRNAHEMGVRFVGEPRTAFR